MSALILLGKIVVTVVFVRWTIEVAGKALANSRGFQERMERKYRHESIEDGVLEYRRAHWKAQHETQGDDNGDQISDSLNARVRALEERMLALESLRARSEIQWGHTGECLPGCSCVTASVSRNAEEPTE